MLCDFHAYATLPARDIARARRFYEEVLGFEPARVNEGGVQYNANGSVFFLYPSRYAGTNEATSLALQVDGDLAAVVDDLRKRGVQFEEYDFPDAGIKTTQGIVTTAGVSNAWFKDTEGNIIGLIKADSPLQWPEDEVLLAVAGGRPLTANEDF